MNKIFKNSPCPDCGNFTNRGLSIDAVIVKDGQVLLVKRGQDPEKGLWGTPGGFVDWDETVEDTVVREVKEETSLDVKNLKLVGVFSSPKRHPKQVINLVYLVEAVGDLKHSDDAIDVKWFDLNKLPDRLAFDHKQNIIEALKLL